MAILTVENFKNQLIEAMADCNTTDRQDIMRMPYNEPTILKIVAKYNLCKGQTSYIVPKIINRKRLVFLVGVTKPLVKVSDYYNYYETTYQGAVSPYIGVAFEQGYNRLRDKVGFGLELTLSPVKTHFSTYEFIYRRTVFYTLNSFSTKFSPYLRYAFSVGKIQPYIKGGFGLTYFLKPQIERYYTESTDPTPMTVVPLVFSNLAINYWTALGVKINNFFLEPRFEGVVGDQLGQNANKANVKRFSILCGYVWDFNKK
jgi:hypothetical protein